jgi:hypothetical protein
MSHRTRLLREPRNRVRSLRLCAAAAFVSVAVAATTAHAQEGTWTALPADPLITGHNGYALLLTDGRILFKQDNVSANWSIYTPDSHGKYETGTWSPAATSHVQRHYFPQAVLSDGRVFVAGGELVSGTDHATVEWYDPVANTWTQGQDLLFAGGGDLPYQMLADGRILLAADGNSYSQIWDPRTNLATRTGAELPPATVGEATWVLLPDSTVLDFSWNPAQKYLPSTGQWINVGTPPVTLWDAPNSEVGPGLLLYTGKVLAIGGPGHTALYTPGANPTDPGSWLAGPNLPPSSASPTGLRYADDVPACIEPNGKVLFVTSGTAFSADPEFDEYDPATNTIARLNGPPGVSPASFWLRMLALPSGQILITGTDTNDYLYTPVGGPNQAWRPTIQSITARADGSYLVSGTQLNGLSQGAAYGDDGFAETNYPLVRLVDAQQRVFYARTHDMSTMGVATGSTPVTAVFNLPANIPSGTYSLSVVANGIESAPQSFVVGGNAGPVVSAVASVYTSWPNSTAPVGYCATVTVTNNGPGAIQSWNVDLALGNAVYNNGGWNAQFTPASGGALHAVNVSYNGSLALGASTQFGFCAQASTPVPPPNVVQASGS